jgi:hypothetical protein
MSNDEATQEQANFDDALKALTGEEQPVQEVPQDEEVPTEEPKEEAAPEEPKEEDKPSETTTSLYKALTEQDRELRQLRKQIKQSGKAEDIEEYAKKNPREFLNKFGFTFEKVFDLFADEAGSVQKGESHTADKELLAKIDKLEQKLAKQEEEYRRDSINAAYEKDLGLLNSRASKDAERWHFVNKMKERGSLNMAYQVASHIYEQTGQAPEFEDVLDEVEKHFEKEAKLYHDLLGHKNKLSQKPAPEPPVVTKQKESVPSLDGSIGSAETPEELTDEERFALALKELEKDQDD